MSLKAFRQNLIKKMGEANFAKVRSARIGLAGAGGLGSNCALNLVRAGFSKLTIADFDIVDSSNLDRQFYFLDQVGMNKVEALKNNLLRINPELELKVIKERLDRANIGKVFVNCSVVAECFDRAEYKSMFVEELLRMKKFIVTASGLGGFGASDDIKVHRVRDNLVIIGDLESDIAERPAISPRVNVAAAKQADVILEYIINRQQK